MKKLINSVLVIILLTSITSCANINGSKKVIDRITDKSKSIK